MINQLNAIKLKIYKYKLIKSEEFGECMILYFFNMVSSLIVFQFLTDNISQTYILEVSAHKEMMKIIT